MMIFCMLLRVLGPSGPIFSPFGHCFSCEKNRMVKLVQLSYGETLGEIYALSVLLTSKILIKLCNEV